MMNQRAGLPNEDFFWLLQQAGVPPRKVAALKPDFLVVSPPKTGSTWLADNLRRHPGVFVPAIKEVKYFTSFFRGLDLGWYLDHFTEAGDRLKGEVSPSYALLPSGRIRLIRRLFPDLKIVFLMREPVARAWSHARHVFRYREATFADWEGALEAVTDERWCEALAHDWLLASSDYLGQLRRWLSVFPREQVFVGFYESIVHEPERLFRDVLAFLGATDPALDLSSLPLRERVLPGLPATIPVPVARFARRLLHRRSRELEGYLRRDFGLAPPSEWDEILHAPEGLADDAPAAFRRAQEDEYLCGVLAQEERFPDARRVVQTDYRGHWLVFDRGRFLALAHGEPSEQLDEAGLWRALDAGGGFAAPSLPELKERVDQHFFEVVARTGSEREARLARQLEEATARLDRLEAEIGRLGQGYSPYLRRLRLAWHRLRAVRRPRLAWPGATPAPSSGM
jgi:hypothetical protein